MENVRQDRVFLFWGKNPESRTQDGTGFFQDRKLFHMLIISSFVSRYVNGI